MRRVLRAVAGLLLALALPAWGASGTWRVEVVGVAPASGDPGHAMEEHQRALDDALARAALRAAAKLLETTPEALEAEGGLAALVEGHPASYAVRFQVLEDRGERRALLSADPRVAHERVLRVAVDVDTERLATDLRAAGRLEPTPTEAAPEVVRLELVELRSWWAFDRLRDALAGSGELRVVPQGFSAGEALLEVRGARGAGEVLALLEAELPEGIRLRVRAARGHSLRVEVIELGEPPGPATSRAPGA